MSTGKPLSLDLLLDRLTVENSPRYIRDQVVRTAIFVQYLLAARKSEIFKWKSELKKEDPDGVWRLKGYGEYKPGLRWSQWDPTTADQGFVRIRFRNNKWKGNPLKTGILLTKWGAKPDRWRDDKWAKQVHLERRGLYEIERLHQREKAMKRGKMKNAMFYSQEGEELTDKAYEGLVRRYMGVDEYGDRISTHDLRRARISHLQGRTDPRKTQKLAGHAKLDTTMIYMQDIADESIAEDLIGG